jgi:NADH-quinone oxidoreductase subunit J
MEAVVFAISAVIILAGALGVVSLRNPVHAALSLVATLFGVAVLFIAEEANFLAAVQVIVYAGAIVILFLFVIMLLGVDRLENLRTDALIKQRYAGIVLGVLLAAGLLYVLLASTITGVASAHLTPPSGAPNINDLAHLIFTQYLFPFEVTSVLLVIAVVGAVLLAHRDAGAEPAIDEDEPADDFSEEMVVPAEDEEATA